MRKVQKFYNQSQIKKLGQHCQLNINRQEILQLEYMINKQNTSNIGKCGERTNLRSSAKKQFLNII
jgi:hypothetical protein